MKTSFGEWLKIETKEKGLTQTELAFMVGVQPSQISRIISGERGTTPELLEQIAHALKYPPETVYRAAGLLPQKPVIDELKEQILYEVSELEEKDQQEVLAFIRMKRNLQER